MPRTVLPFVALTLSVAACSDIMTPAQPDTEPQVAMVPVNVSAAPSITTLSITVSASDIPSDLVFNVTMTNGEATDTITIPAGSDRTITVRGYDASNIETHRGSKTVNLTEGLNPQLTVVLQGLTGDQPLVVVLGETTVTVSPETATVSVGGTTQLAALVTDEAGDTLAVSVRWASSHPAVATVDDAGLVSGVSTGSASVIATHGGAGAAASITASESAFPTEGLVAWYPFNGNANDESSFANSSTVVGATLTSDRFGNANSAYFFNGGHYIESPHGDWLNFNGGSTTWAGWARKTTGNDYAHLLSKGLQTSSPYSSVGAFLRYQPNDGLAFSEGATATGTGNGLGCVSSGLTGMWVHLTGVKDTATQTVRLYKDGVLLCEEPFADPDLVTDNSGSLWIGTENGVVSLPSGPQWFFGDLDDLGIWNRALTPEEIAYLANN